MVLVGDLDRNYWQPVQIQSPGYARAASLLAILHVGWKQQWDLISVCPQLVDSVKAIHVQCIHCDNKMDECLLNMKLSVRGALRKTCNVIQVIMIIC